jgi:hypothetical protein
MDTKVKNDAEKVATVEAPKEVVADDAAKKDAEEKK